MTLEFFEEIIKVLREGVGSTETSLNPFEGLLYCHEWLKDLENLLTHLKEASKGRREAK